MSERVRNGAARSAAPGIAGLIALSICAVLPASACGDEGEPAGPIASATGKIAFASCSELFFGCWADLSTINADGSGTVRLAVGAVSYSFTEGAGGFAWSPDGSRIAFVNSQSDVSIVNADGSGLAPLAEEGDAIKLSWSPDGSRIAFTACPMYQDVLPCPSDIYIVNADGSGLTNLTGSDGAWTHHLAAWSPDGSRIAFRVSSDGLTTGRIRVMNADGSGVAALADSLSQSELTELSWSPAGTHIAFRTSSGQIHLVDADGSGLINLSHDTFADDIAWSPDGSRIAFTAVDIIDYSNDEIYVVNADGSGLANLTNHGGTDSHAAWSPSGAWIAFVSTRDGNSEIYVMNADGSGQLRLTDSPENEFAPAWQLAP